MVQRVANRIGQHLAPLGELFFIRCIAGNIFLFDAERSQRPPFIVVPAQPHLGDAAKTLVLGNRPRVKMAMIIDNGQSFGILMVKYPRFFRLQ
ncbi:hypothetical protein D3C86_1919540 [compost metagenome]